MALPIVIIVILVTLVKVLILVIITIMRMLVMIMIVTLVMIVVIVIIVMMMIIVKWRPQRLPGHRVHPGTSPTSASLVPGTGNQVSEASEGALTPKDNSLIRMEASTYEGFHSTYEGLQLCFPTKGFLLGLGSLRLLLTGGCSKGAACVFCHLCEAVGKGQMGSALMGSLQSVYFF